MKKDYYYLGMFIMSIRRLCFLEWSQFCEFDVARGRHVIWAQITYFYYLVSTSNLQNRGHFGKG